MSEDEATTGQDQLEQNGLFMNLPGINMFHFMSPPDLWYSNSTRCVCVCIHDPEWCTVRVWILKKKKVNSDYFSLNIRLF